MDAKEAIGYMWEFDDFCESLECLPSYRGAIGLAVNALEKQIPKKLYHYGDSDDGKILCLNCKEDLLDLAECGFNYYPYCGQSIDWS